MRRVRRAVRGCAIGVLGAMLAVGAYTETYRVPGQP
jgi:hypothetical protein